MGQSIYRFGDCEQIETFWINKATLANSRLLFMHATTSISIRFSSFPTNAESYILQQNHRR